jgi:ABC-type multidrug transport system permease subunit
MRRRLSDIACVFRIHLARLRAEAGPFVLAALVFPAVMYMFASGIGGDEGRAGLDEVPRVRFLAGSIVFSVSMTAVSWLGYLLLENRFTGRLKLFATLPLAPSSYVIGIVVFAIALAGVGTTVLIGVARLFGVHSRLTGPGGVTLLGAVVLLTVLCVCGISVIIAARARSLSEGSLLTDSLGAGLVFAAPVYYSPQTLPFGLRIFASILPTTYAASGVRATLMGVNDVAGDLAVLSALAVVTLSIAFRAIRWQDE